MTIHCTIEAMQPFIGEAMTLIACNRARTCGGTFPNRTLEQTDDGMLKIHAVAGYHTLTKENFAYSERHNPVTVYFDMPDSKEPTT